jgi:hypothetical protein
MVAFFHNLYALYLRLPSFVRKFVTDFVETSVAYLIALNLAFPTNYTSLKQVGVVIGVGIAGSLVSALRRAAPGFLTWFSAKFGG